MIRYKSMECFPNQCMDESKMIHLTLSWSELAERIFLMKSFKTIRVQSIETPRYSGTRRWVQLIIINSTGCLQIHSEYIQIICVTIYGAESKMSFLQIFHWSERKRISEFIPSQEDLWGQQLPPSVIIVTNGRENCEWYIPKWLINSTGQHYCIFPFISTTYSPIFYNQILIILIISLRLS